MSEDKFDRNALYTYLVEKCVDANRKHYFASLDLERVQLREAQYNACQMIAECKDVQTIKSCIEDIFYDEILPNADVSVMCKWIAMRLVALRKTEIVDAVPSEYLSPSILLNDSVQCDSHGRQTICHLKIIERAFELDREKAVGACNACKLFEVAVKIKRNDVVAFGLARNLITIDDITRWSTTICVSQNVI